ncbi:MAG: ABC transporter permease [Actinomycetaceae bacterium]|nr:ABC transporter permease [Actinomycetaceae bacterium]
MSNKPQPQERDVENVSKVGGETALKTGSDLESVTEPVKSEPNKSKRLSRGALIRRRFMRSTTSKIGVFGFAFIILLAIIGPYVSPWDYQEVTPAFLKPPSAEHLFGTTQGGRDVLALTLEGLRKSLIIGISVSAIQVTVAAFVGASAAYFGGFFEKASLWVIDLLLVIPSFLLIAVISQSTGGKGSSTFLFILLLAGFGWMLTARVVRSMTLSVKNLEYVTAARYMSVPSHVVITKHIIPNVASYLIIDAALGFVAAVMSETVLSYFGFGVQPPETSLGVLIAEGQGMATTSPWIFMAPATILTLTLIFVNFIGDGLRDAIDPSSKSGGQA